MDRRVKGQLCRRCSSMHQLCRGYTCRRCLAPPRRRCIGCTARIRTVGAELIDRAWSFLSRHAAWKFAHAFHEYLADCCCSAWKCRTSCFVCAHRVRVLVLSCAVRFFTVWSGSDTIGPRVRSCAAASSLHGRGM